MDPAKEGLAFIKSAKSMLGNRDCERTDLRRHNKVIPMKALYRMRPKRHRHLAPLGQDSGMMALCFRESSNAIGEAQGFRKISETKSAL